MPIPRAIAMINIASATLWTIRRTKTANGTSGSWRRSNTAILARRRGRAAPQKSSGAYALTLRKVHGILEKGDYGYGTSIRKSDLIHGRARAGVGGEGADPSAAA